MSMKRAITNRTSGTRQRRLMTASLVAIGLLALFQAPARAAIVVGEGAWAPGIQDWRTPLPGPTAAPADGTVNAAYLLAGGAAPALEADDLWLGQAPLTAVIALRFDAQAAQSTDEPERSPDVQAYIDRITRLPGFNDIEERFITQLSARDWLNTGTETTDPATFTEEDIPIWTPVPEPGQLLMLTAALAVLLAASRMQDRLKRE